MSNTGPLKCFDIPAGYGDDKVVLMVRDPWALFTYWEISKDVEDAVRDKISSRGLTPAKSVLRVYDVTDDANEPTPAQEFELKDWARNWYIHTGNTGRKWLVEVGIVTTTGEFFRLVRSNPVISPRYGMSDVYDTEWACSEDLFYKMFALAGGYGIGKSSMEMREIIDRNLKEWISSGGVSSGMSGSSSFHMFRER